MDTSGAVYLSRDCLSPSGFPSWSWADLSPFAQGYIAAALEDLNRRLFSSGGYTSADFIGFRHLAPETLAAMLKDCAAFENYAAGLGQRSLGYGDGKTFWASRSRGMPGAPTFAAAFPPVTLYLGDDCKIYQREAA